jgi:uncharacterized membrane protein YidH (DUF202 family)
MALLAGGVTAVDPGLQAQRTALAWTRTGQSIIVNALLVLRAGLEGGRFVVSALGIALLLAAAAAIACGAWRRHRLVRSLDSRAPPLLLMQAIMLVTLLACAAGVASITASIHFST